MTALCVMQSQKKTGKLILLDQLSKKLKGGAKAEKRFTKEAGNRFRISPTYRGAGPLQPTPPPRRIGADVPPESD